MSAWERIGKNTFPLPGRARSVLVGLWSTDHVQGRKLRKKAVWRFWDTDSDTPYWHVGSDGDGMMPTHWMEIEPPRS